MSLITDSMLGLYTYENATETEWTNQLETPRSSISLSGVTLNDDGIIFYVGTRSKATLTLPEDITSETGCTIYVAFDEIKPDEKSAGYAETTILSSTNKDGQQLDLKFFYNGETEKLEFRIYINRTLFKTIISYKKRYSKEPFVATIRFAQGSSSFDILSDRNGTVYRSDYGTNLFSGTNSFGLFDNSIVPTKAFVVLAYSGSHTTEHVAENMVYLYNRYFPKFINTPPEYDIYLRGVNELGRDILTGPMPKFCFLLSKDDFGDELFTGYMRLSDKDILSGPIPKFAWRTDIFYNEEAPYTGYMRPKRTTIDFEPEQTREEYIDILDRIRVYSAPHGLDKDFPVLEMEIPLNKPEETKFHLGTKNSISLTAINASINEDLKNRISNLPKTSTILKAAQDNATALIRAGTEGYVTLVKEGGATKELVISDRPDYTEDGARIWRWNINGLGFSSNGYDGNYNTAITMDGSIVANMITTGEMFADRIKGGTLTLGGFDNQYGLGRILSSDGTAEMHLTNGGLNFYQNGEFRSQIRLSDAYVGGDPSVTVTGSAGTGFVIGTDWIGVSDSSGNVWGVSEDPVEIPFITDCWLDENGELQKTVAYLTICKGFVVGH